MLNEETFSITRVARAAASLSLAPCVCVCSHWTAGGAGAGAGGGGAAPTSRSSLAPLPAACPPTPPHCAGLSHDHDRQGRGASSHGCFSQGGGGGGGGGGWTPAEPSRPRCRPAVLAGTCPGSAAYGRTSSQCPPKCRCAQASPRTRARQRTYCFRPRSHASPPTHRSCLCWDLCFFPPQLGLALPPAMTDLATEPNRHSLSCQTPNLKQFFPRRAPARLCACAAADALPKRLVPHGCDLGGAARPRRPCPARRGHSAGRRARPLHELLLRARVLRAARPGTWTAARPRARLSAATHPRTRTRARAHAHAVLEHSAPPPLPAAACVAQHASPSRSQASPRA